MGTFTRTCALAVAALGLATAGCGQQAGEAVTEKMIEKQLAKEAGGQADVKLDGDKISVKTDQAQVSWDAAGGVEKPKDFPADLFVYPQAKILMSAKEGDSHTMTLKSEDKAEAIVKAYRKRMAEGGWKEEQSVNMPGQSVLTFSKEGRQATVMVMDGDEGGCQIVMNVAKN